MKPSEQARFDSLYQQHLNVLRLQGKADVTIDAYSRAVRRVPNLSFVRVQHGAAPKRSTEPNDY